MSARVYVDSSALLKRVLPEVDRPALLAQLDDLRSRSGRLLTSRLSRVEVFRALDRHLDEQADWGQVTRATERVLEGIDLVEVTESILDLAAELPDPLLRTLDAIHVASALAVGADVVITRDRRMGAACAKVGLSVA